MSLVSYFLEALALVLKERWCTVGNSFSRRSAAEGIEDIRRQLRRTRRNHPRHLMDLSELDIANKQMGTKTTSQKTCAKSCRIQPEQYQTAIVVVVLQYWRAGKSPPQMTVPAITNRAPNKCVHLWRILPSNVRRSAHVPEVLLLVLGLILILYQAQSNGE